MWCPAASRSEVHTTLETLQTALEVKGAPEGVKLVTVVMDCTTDKEHVILCGVKLACKARTRHNPLQGVPKFA